MQYRGVNVKAEVRMRYSEDAEMPTAKSTWEVRENAHCCVEAHQENGTLWTKAEEA